MRYLQWSLLASTLWHVGQAAVRSKRWLVAEDGHVAEEPQEPRLLRSETHGRIRPGSLQERQQDCDNPPCPVDCALSDWSPWATCSPFCQGTTKRNRTVLREPENGGLVCGKVSQVKNCSNECVDCEWDNFTEWGECSVSCGGGVEKRSRDVKVKQVGGGTNCSGNSTEERACNTQDCEWDEWGAWTPCSKSCGSSVKKRSRAIKIPKANGGKDCVGVADDERICQKPQCPKDCVVTEWTDWSPCKPYCLGKQTRNRNVTVENAFGGQACPDLEDSRVCSHYCVDCKWSDWTDFTKCSKSCEGGKKSRAREQSFQLRETPSALVPGYTLLGPGQCQDFYQTTQDADAASPEACAKTCSADVQCSFFSLNLGVACNKYNASVGECELRPRGQSSHKSYRKEQWTQTFGYELKRNQKCTKPRAEKLALKEARAVCSADEKCGGLYDSGCLGSAVLCDGFGNDTEVGSCMHRKVEIGGGEKCTGNAQQVEDCNIQLCPINCKMGDWSAWGECAPSCNGTETRSRPILQEARNGGTPCGETVEQKPCSKICVDCRWSDWSAWDTCSASCAGGLYSRSRYIAVQAEGPGKKCEGNSSEIEACNIEFCPSDCETSGWSQWTDCEPYCNGTQNRSRVIQKPAAYGGAGCGALSEMRTCANFCMDCQLSSWSDWTSCSLTCAGGLRQRSRNEVFVQRKTASNEESATNGESQNEENMASLLETGEGSAAFGYEKKLGVRCDVEHQQTKDGAGQTPDEAEGACSADHNCGGLYDKGCNGWLTICTVGLMLEAEANSCAYVKKEIGDGQPCTGDIFESEDCSSELCPVDCKHSDWTEWTECNPFCQGVMNRSRKILEHPANGGAACGTIAEVQNCSNECVDCQWGSWGTWSSCSVSCGGSTQHRSRVQLVPQAGRGLPCEGSEAASKPCGEISCPVDCKMEDWSDWTECTPYCSGTQMRSRGVVSEPLAGGQPCGEASIVVNCSNACVDCEVSPWSVWSLCSASCGSGRQSRSRLVLVEAEGQGAACPEGLEDQKEGCNSEDCPVDCGWADWSPWNGCSVTCGGGNKTRTRGKTRMEQFGGSPCEGEESEAGSCSEIACPQDCLWSDWGAWGNCSMSCGGGNQGRYRYVTQIALGDGTNCSGEARDLQKCNEEACTKDCEFMDWEDWSECSMSCGIGNRSRTRETNAEVNGGTPCDPAVPTRQSEECRLPCPRDCVWGDWGVWTNCSKSCGEGLSAGSSTRHRLEAITAAFGGADCEGSTLQQQRCNDQPCPIDCEWKDWTAWTECVQPCGGEGSRQRSRNSTEAMHGGEDCIGESTEVSHCTVLGGCSVNCTWEDWNEWTACSASCGDGNRVRFRFVADEAVGPHGLHCVGEPEEEISCETGVDCPVDCEYNDWKDWGECEAMPCGPSKKLRSRTKQAARYGGKACDGNASQEEECFIQDVKIIECDENGKPVTTTTTTTSTSTLTTTTTFTTTTVTTTVTTTTTSFADVALTTVALSANSAASAASAAANITVDGTMVIDVSPSAEGFSSDSAAVESVKETIAQEAGVSTDAVIIKTVAVEATPASLLSLGSRPRRKRRETPGTVKIEYEIVPQLNNKNANDVMNSLDEATQSDEVPQQLETSLARHNSPYTVKVTEMDTKEVSKKDRHTIRESVLHSGGPSMFQWHVLATCPLVVLWLMR